ncbi:hypothetical protein BJ878DRAFT_521759 [Calycina marina]|uniref:Cytosine deaminase n=1 Tax=Calycina marina TaxID=1763456 RepID=A0A9P7YWR8_9HELO|nr:hypothetical protein BJ878DRAFT_521759 [Calycina marina]
MTSQIVPQHAAKTSFSNFHGVHLPNKPPNSLWNLSCKDGLISEISEYEADAKSQPDGRFVAPSLCHPHIHLDKCFLLSHEKYADLEIEKGDFAEALSLTNEAKARFEHDDLVERGAALIEESIGFGVTSMRAYVEVDATVGMVCLHAGLVLKEQFRERCYVQICVFAQDPIFTYDDGGVSMRSLLEKALQKPGVEAFGCTPYVEEGVSAFEGSFGRNLEHNIKWTIAMAMIHNLHLDFHIDYNLDPIQKVSIYTALDNLKAASWPTTTQKELRTVVFGHCTRLTLFTADEWRSLRERVGVLPVSFVGLPTSDLFMMGRKSGEGEERVRGTLRIPQMIQTFGFNAAIGINNVGNAFTPYGSCDPVSLAGFCVGVYQAGTKADAEVLYQCVSGRAKMAIGVLPWDESSSKLELKVGNRADFVAFGRKSGGGVDSIRARKSIQNVVNDAGHERETIYVGTITSP